MIPAQHRPSPNSPVFLLPADRVEQVLGLAIPPEDKPIRLDLMEGAADVKVNMPANLANRSYRVTSGVLGTTGGEQVHF